MSELARICLTEIAMVGHHGYHRAEKELGQRFEIDVEMFVDISRAAESDELDDAVDYEQVYRLVEKVVGNERYSLLEALVADVADSIWEDFDIEGLTVRIRKPNVPHCPNLEHVEIEVHRGRVEE